MLSAAAAAWSQSCLVPSEQWGLPLNFSVRSFSALARFDGGSELTRLLRFSDSMVVVVGDDGEDERKRVLRPADAQSLGR